MPSTGDNRRKRQRYSEVNARQINGMKLLIEQKSGKKYLVQDSSKDFYTSGGTISGKELASGKKIIHSSAKKPFLCIDAGFPDIWEALQRGPQAIIQKDIGLILAKTGVNKESRIVDAGGGSGSLCLSLANVCKEVIVYEKNAEHCRILLKNIALSGFKNIKVKQQDIYEGIAEMEADVITLDLPEPWKAVKHAENALRVGGYLVVYLPNLLQMKQFIEAAGGTDIKVLETVELLERRWKIEDKIMRPEFEMLGHTGFLAFCRKLAEL